PEGNVTGVAFFAYDILPKRVELLSEIVPHFKRLAIIIPAHIDQKSIENIEQNIKMASNALGLSWQHYEAGILDDYNDIFQRIAAEHFDAAYIVAGLFNNEPESITRVTELSLYHRIPCVAELGNLAKRGLLLSYGQDYIRDFVRASDYVDKILRGAKPS